MPKLKNELYIKYFCVSISVLPTIYQCLGSARLAKYHTNGRNSFGGWMRKISVTIWEKIVGVFSSIGLWFCNTKFDWIPIQLPIDQKWIGGQFFVKNVHPVIEKECAALDTFCWNHRIAAIQMFTIPYKLKFTWNVGIITMIVWEIRQFLAQFI